MTDALPPARRPRRLDTMSKPTRNVPYKLQLLNPSRRMARSMVTLPPLHALPEVAAAGPSSPTSSPPYSQMASQMASQMGSAVGSNFMTTSQSLPLLQPIDSEIARSRLLDDPRHYRKDHLTIWGGADYMRTRIKVKSKYLERFQLQGDAAERARLRKLESIKKLMRESARIFQKADEDGDGMLNFYEFCNLIKLQSRLQRRAHLLSDNPTAPTDFAPLPTREMLKDWFHLIDANHSGSLSMTEFFAFSLREALAQTMDGPPNITAFLSIWDTDQDNKLDSDELQKATHALGFSAITRELLEMCEVEADGESIKIAQVTAALREKAESEEARPFFEVAGAIAQRPIESVSKDASKKAKKAADEAAEGEGDASSARAPKKKSPMRGPNSGKANEALFPPMDARTSFAITMALGRIDQRAKDDKFYDPADEATRKKEDVGQALSILRSWMRLKALKALEVFQSWDQSGNLSLTRREVADGLARYGLELNAHLITLIFDQIAEGYKLQYDEFKSWFESTKFDHLNDEQRDQRAAVTIQKCIRSRLAKKRVQQRRTDTGSPVPQSPVPHSPEHAVHQQWESSPPPPPPIADGPSSGDVQEEA